MRFLRYILILFAVWMFMLGGGFYYNLIFEVRVIHHLVMLLALTGWLVWRIYRKQGLPELRLSGAVFVLLAAWLLLAVTALDARMAFERLWFGVAYMVIFFVLAGLFQYGRQRAIMDTAFIIGTVLMLITFFEISMWFLGFGLYETGWVMTGRMPGFADLPMLVLAQGNSNLLAAVITPLIVWMFVWSFTCRNEAQRIILRITAILLVPILLATTSRGALVSLTVSAVIVTWAYLKEQRRIPRLLQSHQYSLLLTIGICLAALLLYTGWENDTGRRDMWTSAVSMTSDHLIDGVGYGMYGRSFREYRMTGMYRDHLATAHSLYFNIAAEGGVLLVGVLLYGAAAWIRAARRAYSYLQQQPFDLRLRWWAMLASLLGFAFHSMVDMFTVTSTVLIMLVPLAYVISVPFSQHMALPVPSRPRTPAFAGLLLVIIVGGGVALVQWDRAQARYQQSWNARTLEESITMAREAEAMDPALNLYDLHLATVYGFAAHRDASYRQDAVEAYEAAVTLEPTWDVGWINLAWAYEQVGDYDAAIEALKKAAEIRRDNLAYVHMGRIYDAYIEGASAETVRDYYRRGIGKMALPLSSWWWETPQRRAAVMEFASYQDAEVAWRSLSPHDMNAAMVHVPANPQTAAEWYAAAEASLTSGDAARALVLFSEAISLASDDQRGDYHAARARAYLASGDFAQALGDLDLADVFSVRYENTNFIRAQVADAVGDDTKRREWLFASIPDRMVPQNFAAVMYERSAVFDVLPPMRSYTIPQEHVRAWQALALEYTIAGARDSAELIRSRLDSVAPSSRVASS